MQKAKTIERRKRVKRTTRQVSAGPSRHPRPRPDSPAWRLFEAERLFRDFVELTPYPFRPLVKTFDSFAAYERWKRAQTSPWYR